MVTMGAAVSDEPRLIRVADLREGLSDAFWTTPAARAVLTLFGDDALRHVLVSLAARISDLYASPERDMIDMRSPLPETILLPVSAFGAVFGLPFSRAVSAAGRSDDDDVDD